MRKLMFLGLMASMLVGSVVRAEDDPDVGAIRRSMPPAYGITVVKQGEQRTSEFFFTTEIAGAGNAAFTTDKSSHAGRFAGVMVYCFSIDAVKCTIPAVQKNGQPITDQVSLGGGQSVVIPFDSILSLDTSDSIALASNATTVGTAGTEPGRIAVEFYTPRSWQAVAGGY